LPKRARKVSNNFTLVNSRVYDPLISREGNIVITSGDEDGTAQNISYWKGINGDEMTSMGRHIDSFKLCDDSSWRFIHRKITFTWTKQQGHIQSN
jgi:hypothetical protein